MSLVSSEFSRWAGFPAILLAIGLLYGASSAKATTVNPPEFSELVNQSDYIVRAVVKSVVSEYASPGARKIITKVELDVREVIAGKPPQPLVLTMLGGKVGDQEMILEGAPRFTAGEEQILFVHGNGRQFYPLVAMMHGVYPVEKEASGRQFMARSNHVPLQDPAEVVLPMTTGGPAVLLQKMRTSADALTPAQFIQQIRAAVKPSNARLHDR